MPLTIKEIKRPNLEAILAKEFKLFITVHQPNLLNRLDDIRNRLLSSFFVKNIFPIANEWISTISYIAVTEVTNPLEIKVQNDGTFTKEDLIRIRKLAEDSKKINCYVVLNLMKTQIQSLKSSFINIELFLPQWWIAVREVWHMNFLSSLLSHIDSEIQTRPKAGVFNFTGKMIPDRVIDILNKGKKFIPHNRDNCHSAVNRFQTELLEQIVWYSKKFEKGGKKRKIPCKEGDLVKVLQSSITNAKEPKDKVFYLTILNNLQNSIDTVVTNTKNNGIFQHEELEVIREYSSNLQYTWNSIDNEGGLLLLETNVIKTKEMDLIESLKGSVINEEPEAILEIFLTKI